MKKTVMDTNFLLLPYQYGVDVFGQLKELVPDGEIIVGSCILNELKRLAKNKGKTGSAARLALKILRLQKVNVVETGLPADRWIFSYARSYRASVCTNDRGLRQRIKRLRLKCIVLKRRKRLGWG